MWSQCLRTPQCGLQPGMAPWLRASKVQRMEVCCFGPSPALSKTLRFFMKSLSKTPLQFDVGSLLKVIMEKKGRMSPYYLKAIPLQAGFENGWIPYSWPYLHTKFIWCSLWGGRVGAIYMGGASAVLGLLLGAAATWWNSMTGYGLNLEMTLQ